VTRLLTLGCLVLALVLLIAPTAGAGARVVIGVGPIWWPGPYWPYYAYHPYYAPYYAYPYYPYVYQPAPVIVQEPPVYVQRPVPPPAAPPTEPPALPEGPYWYYCASAGAYYPAVAQCPEPWVKVPPRPE
jgi:hypothetical protein